MNEDRLLVDFDAIPSALVHAIVSAEDKHFFTHNGLDLPRIAKAAYVDVKDRRKAQGASTLTMQLVRGLWLEPNKVWMRKVTEALMTIHLEHEWSKKKIFETYVNQVYLGREAGWSIRGFWREVHGFFSARICATLRCRKRRCWRAWSSGRAISIRFNIRNAQGNGAIWFS